MADRDIEVRVKLSQLRKFQADAQAAARSTERIGAAGEKGSARAARGTDALANSAQRSSGAMALVATGAKTGALAVGAMGAAASVAGVKFNATMEQNKIALANFLGGAENAQAYLDRMYDLASKTPFEFADLTEASVKLMGFGMAARQVEGWMHTLGDAVAGVGGGQEEIQRATLALGQMQAKGKVSMEELNQLTEARIPAIKILKDELGLTSEQMAKIGTEGISTSKALPALQRGLNDMFGGSAAKQAKSFNGQVSSLKDSVSQLLGQGTRPLFSFLRDTALPALNDLIDGFKSGTGAGGALKTGLIAIRDGARAVGTWIKGAATDIAAFVEKAGIVRFLGKAFNVARDAVTDLIGVVSRELGLGGKGASNFGKTVMTVLNGIKDVLGFLAKAWVFVFENVFLPVAKRWLPGITQVIGGVVRVFRGLIEIISGIFSGDFSKVWAGVKRMFSGGVQIIIGVLRTATAPIRTVLAAIGSVISTVFTGAWNIAKRVFSTGARVLVAVIRNPIGAIRAVVTGIGRTISSVFRWAWNTARNVFRVGVTAIVAVVRGAIGRARAVAGLVGRAITTAFNVIKNIPGFVSRIFGDVIGFIRGLPTKVASAAVGLFNGIKDSFRDAINWIITKWNALSLTVGGGKIELPTGDISIPSITLNTPDLPHLASGGTIGTGGLAVVGERGPEIVALPRAATVTPASESRRVMSGRMLAAPPAERIPIVIRNMIHLDGRQVAESTSRVVATAKARA